MRQRVGVSQKARRHCIPRNETRAMTSADFRRDVMRRRKVVLEMKSLGRWFRWSPLYLYCTAEVERTARSTSRRRSSRPIEMSILFALLLVGTTDALRLNVPAGRSRPLFMAVSTMPLLDAISEAGVVGCDATREQQAKVERLASSLLALATMAHKRRFHCQERTNSFIR